MAVKSSTTSNQSSTTTGSADPVAQKSKPQMGGSSLFSILSQQMKNSVMSPEAEAHLEELKKQLGTAGINVQISRIPFDSFECAVVANPVTRTGIALLYSENQTSSVIRNLVEVKTEISKKMPDVRVVQPIVVPPIDFPKVRNLAKCIQSVIGFNREDLHTNLLKLTYTDDSRKDKIQFVITNKLSQVEDVMARFSPHTVPARCDYGLAIYVTSSNDFYYSNKTEINYNKLTPIMSISAYNKFMISPNPAKYLPIITISEIASAIPDPGMLLLGLQLAIDRFLLGGDYMLPYRSYEKDRPNLGALTMDDGKPGFIVNDDEKRMITTTMFEDVWCSIDHVTGRFMIPGMERFDPAFGAEVQATARQFVADFLGIDTPNVPNIVKHSFESKIGYVGAPGSVVAEMMDSRKVDFINCAAPRLLSFNSLAFMLAPVINQKMMDEFLSSHYKYSELFLCKNMILDPEAHKFIRGYMADLNVFSDVENRETINIDQLTKTVFNMTGTGTNYGAGSIGQTNFGNGGNPMNTTIWD